MVDRELRAKTQGGLKINGEELDGSDPIATLELLLSNLATASSVALTDIVVVLQTSTHRKATLAQVETLLSSKAKISSNDTTPGYLNGKLVAGTGATLTEGTDGGNETLTLAVSNSYTLEFDSEDLASGVLTVEHNLNQAIVGAQIWDNNGVWTRPDKMWRVDDNTLAVDLSTFNDAGLVTGTWKVWVSR